MKRKSTQDISERRKKYREEYKENHKQFMAKVRKQKPEFSIEGVVVKAAKVDMESFCGTQSELESKIEAFYENRGFEDFGSTLNFPPSILDTWGQDFALRAQGIYYLSYFSRRDVRDDRKVWVPSLHDPRRDEETAESLRRHECARKVAALARSNESWCKSEFAWEADAWAHLFRRMREDPMLEVDKRGLTWVGSKTDELHCTLTGEQELKVRIPDATFGLTTFLDRHSTDDVWTHDLHRERLDQLLLHPNYGLICDPKVDDDISLAFPFMVYEAKGWRGDHRDARRQATFAAATYLDMLDNLARTPGPLGSSRVYQTRTSHRYQVFALTSFGAYWHVLVGHSRPRSKDEHTGSPGLSDTVHIFQRVWSGDITDENRAFELISLLDQIHLWSITEHRTFVLEHVKAWHAACEHNYHMEWSSGYDLGDEKKHARDMKIDTDLTLPSWAAYLSEPQRLKLQARSKLSLKKHLRRREAARGKRSATGESCAFLLCSVDDCNTSHNTLEELLYHVKDTHCWDARALSALKHFFVGEGAKAHVGERRRKGIDSSGHRLFVPGDTSQPLGEERVRIPLRKHA